MWVEYVNSTSPIINPNFLDYFLIGVVLGFAAGWIFGKMDELCRKMKEKT